MGRILFGLLLAAAGVLGLVVFWEPVDIYTAEIAGSGDRAGEIVDVDCRDGAALDPFTGDERAESECEAAEDGVKAIRIVKLAGAAIVVVIGLWLVAVALRARLHDFRSRLDYKRMVKQHFGPKRRT